MKHKSIKINYGGEVLQFWGPVSRLDNLDTAHRSTCLTIHPNSLRRAISLLHPKNKSVPRPPEPLCQPLAHAAEHHGIHHWVMGLVEVDCADATIGKSYGRAWSLRGDETGVGQCLDEMRLFHGARSRASA